MNRTLLFALPCIVTLAMPAAPAATTYPIRVTLNCNDPDAIVHDAVTLEWVSAADGAVVKSARWELPLPPPGRRGKSVRLTPYANLALGEPNEVPCDPAKIIATSKEVRISIWRFVEAPRDADEDYWWEVQHTFSKSLDAKERQDLLAAVTSTGVMITTHGTTLSWAKAATR